MRTLRGAGGDAAISQHLGRSAFLLVIPTGGNNHRHPRARGDPGGGWGGEATAATDVSLSREIAASPMAPRNVRTNRILRAEGVAISRLNGLRDS
jgi:hypothetical protein